MNKNSIKKITSMRLFLPIVCLVAVLLVNLITTPGFFKVSINNGVLYGYIVDENADDADGRMLQGI